MDVAAVGSMPPPPAVPPAPEAEAGGKDAEALQARLARKAASARLARAKHKSSVQGLEEQVKALSERAAALEAKRLLDAKRASQALHDELRDALPPDQWQTLSGWLRAAAESTAEPTEMRAEQIASSSLISFLTGGASTPVQVAHASRYACASDSSSFSFFAPSCVSDAAASTPALNVAVSTAPPPKAPSTSQTSPTNIMAEPDDLLACALQGMVGLANCTPRGPQPAHADLPPAMEQLPPPAKRSRSEASEA